MNLETNETTQLVDFMNSVREIPHLEVADTLVFIAGKNDADIFGHYVNTPLICYDLKNKTKVWSTKSDINYRTIIGGLKKFVRDSIGHIYGIGQNLNKDFILIKVDEKTGKILHHATQLYFNDDSKIRIPQDIVYDATRDQIHILGYYKDASLPKSEAYAFSAVYSSSLHQITYWESKIPKTQGTMLAQLANGDLVSGYTSWNYKLCQADGWVEVKKVLPELTAPILISPANESTLTASTVTLNWHSNITTGSYELMISNKPDFLDFKIYTSSVAPMDISDLEDCQTYYWKVRTKLRTAYSDWSAVHQFHLMKHADLNSLIITPSVLNYEILLQWNSVAEKAEYQLYRGASGNVSQMVPINEWNSSLTFKDQKFARDTTVFYAVKARKCLIEGNHSPAVEVVYTALPTGLEAANEKSFSIYPNPAYEWFTIQLTNGTPLKPEVQLYGLDGRQVPIKAVKKWQEAEFRVDVKDIQPGTYLLLIKQGDKVYQHRLVILRDKH